MIVKANEKIFNKYCRHHYQIFSFIKSYLLILIENLQKKIKTIYKNKYIYGMHLYK